MLRTYQSRLLDGAAYSLTKHTSTILQLPTGGGKTHIAAALTKQFSDEGKRVWFICHRREIIQQTGRALTAAGVAHGYLSPDYLLEPMARVQVGSIDFLRGKVSLFAAPDLIIWDECHHIPAPSWAGLKAKFPHSRHLGLSATPSRLDGIGLGDFFDDLISGPDTRQLIEWGYLSNYRLFAPTIPDLRGVSVNMGDYAQGQLAERMGGSTLIGDAIDHYKRKAPGANALVFAVSVKASQAIVDRFNAAGIPAMHIDGDTPKDKRDDAVAALGRGEIKVISNVGVFTEGFDLPAIGAVILLRPTKSFALYRQMIGRGLRTDEGKAATVILDHAGLMYEHGLPDDFVQWELKGTRQTPAHSFRSVSTVRRCPECSAVHAHANECPECGHAYTGNERTIDEVYGELMEVRRRPGYVNTTEFGEMIGVHPNTVRKLVEQGLPRDMGGMISIRDGMAWVEANDHLISPTPHKPPRGSTPGEYETADVFGARIGYSSGGLQRLKTKGLPTARNGWVHVERGLAWVEEYKAGGHKRGIALGIAPKDSADGEYESRPVFAARVGMRKERMHDFAAEGMPVGANGWVHVKQALEWLAARPLPKHKVRRHQSIEMLAVELGTPVITVNSLIKRGMPINDDGSLDVHASLEWVRSKNQRYNWTGMKYLPFGHMTTKGFAKLTGRKTARHLVSWGLPIEPNGLVDPVKAWAWLEQRASIAA